MRKALMLASVASMIDQFNIPNIELLQSLGYQVDVVADFKNPGTITHERAMILRRRLDDMGVRVKSIAIPRSLNPVKIVSAYNQVRKLILSQHYNLIHCHSPIGGAITRVAANSERKKGTKVIYTAHGFHFYDGAPIKNWIIYYSVEKWLSRYTDFLITINKEDYRRAKKKFKAKEVVYVPGVGIDLNKFNSGYVNREEKRKELGIARDQKMLLSVGELSTRKNHKVVIGALAELHDLSIHYYIAGKGEQGEELEKLAEEKGVNLHLLGYRTDISALIQSCDFFVFPSLQEGLPVALMEAIACRVPVVCSDIRGNTDLITFTDYLFSPDDIHGLSGKIKSTLEKENAEVVEQNYKTLQNFDILTVENKIERIYEGGYCIG